jgi:uncharacterized protein YigE (DUF2233 family)
MKRPQSDLRITAPPLGAKSAIRLRFVAPSWMSIFALIAASASGAENGGPCRPVTYERNSYVVCQFDLRHYTPKLFWKQPNGEPYGSLKNIPRRGDSDTRQLVFATNGGMYQSDRSPVGLHIENGRELVGANTAAGTGNFYIKPNGIFYVSGENAGILETRLFLRRRPHSDIATQSGPMLVINGGINSKFLPISNSRKIRNGVGVQDDHRVVFVISNDPVTFGEFAQFFRDALHCSNALYLDGSISSIYAPSVQRADYLWPLGPIIGVYARGN